jgi:hypothetical protein
MGTSSWHSLIATIPRRVQNCQCSKLLLLNAISRLCTRRQVHRQNVLLGFKSACPGIPQERERQNEIEDEDLITLPCRVRAVFNLL